MAALARVARRAPGPPCHECQPTRARVALAGPARAPRTPAWLAVGAGRPARASEALCLPSRAPTRPARPRARVLPCCRPSPPPPPFVPPRAQPRSPLARGPAACPALTVSTFALKRAAERTPPTRGAPQRPRPAANAPRIHQSVRGATHAARTTRCRAPGHGYSFLSPLPRAFPHPSKPPWLCPTSLPRAPPPPLSRCVEAVAQPSAAPEAGPAPLYTLRPLPSAPHVHFARSPICPRSHPISPAPARRLALPPHCRREAAPSRQASLLTQGAPPPRRRAPRPAPPQRRAQKQAQKPSPSA
jgi:hypothetical protein